MDAAYMCSHAWAWRDRRGVLRCIFIFCLLGGLWAKVIENRKKKCLFCVYADAQRIDALHFWVKDRVYHIIRDWTRPLSGSMNNTINCCWVGVANIWVSHMPVSLPSCPLKIPLCGAAVCIRLMLKFHLNPTLPCLVLCVKEHQSRSTKYRHLHPHQHRTTRYNLRGHH